MAVAEALGWTTLAMVAFGGFRFQVRGRAIPLVDVGLLASPWFLLLAAGIGSGALTRLEDVPLLRRLGALLRAGAARPALAVGAAASAYSAVLVVHAFRSYAVHASGAYDLGIFDQVLWATLHGAPLRSSIKGDISILGDHFEPVLALIAPIYLLWDDPRCLLLFQTLALAAGVVPTYLLARRRFGAGRLSLAFAVAYLAYGPTRYLNAYHFHPVALVVPLFLLAALWLEEGRVALFLCALALAATCQENVPLAIAGWGLSLALFRPRRLLLGAGLAASGLALFLLLVLVLLPRFAGAERFGYLSRYGHLGQGVGDVLRTLLSRPWLVPAALVTPPPKIEYLLRVFGPLAFLPLFQRGWCWLLPVAPVLLQNTLAAYPKMYSVAFQYTAPMTPFLLLGAMDGARGLLERAGSGKLWATPRTIGVALAAGLVAAGGESQVFQARALRWDARYERIEPVVAAIPPGASVSAQAGIFSHVSHRHHVYLFPDRVGDVDYVVLDRRGFLYSFQFSREEYERVLASLPERGYALVLEQDGFFVFSRGGGRAGR